MYIRYLNGTPEIYSIGQLRKDNPNTSFPEPMPLDRLAEWNVFPYTQEDLPSYDSTIQTTALDDLPVLVNGSWVRQWTVAPKSSEDAKKSVRSKRNELLRDTDWTQLADSPVENRDAWVRYRKDLRDLPDQEGFPFNVVWPVAP
jgi:hypothetical protein